MNYQFFVCEEETVTLDLPGSLNNFLLFLGCQRWHVVDELPRVVGVWYDETELELIWSKNAPSEIVALDHLHLVYWLSSNSKIQGESNSLEFEEVWAQMVLDNSCCGVIIFTGLVVNILLRNINQSDTWCNVSDLEASKFELGPVVRKFAKELVCWLFQLLHVVCGDDVGVLLFLEG